jgi:hypothetical protein
LKEQNDEREDDLNDEIKREDGLVRHWMFLNGDKVRLFSALVAAFLGVLWCFLYIFGAGRTILGNVLLALALISFWVWRVFGRQIREYEESGWKKDKHSSRRDKSRSKLSYCFGYLFSLVLDLYCYCNGGEAANRPFFPHSHYLPLRFPHALYRQEKAAGSAGESQHGYVGGIATGAGDRAGDGGENFCRCGNRTARSRAWTTCSRSAGSGRSGLKKCASI